MPRAIKFHVREGRQPNRDVLTVGSEPRKLRTWICFVVTFCCFLWLLSLVTRHHRHGNEYMTYGTLWASGHAAIEHVDPFAAYPATYTTRIGSMSFPELNLNPPWTLPLLELLAHLPIDQFLELWSLIIGGTLIAGCLILISTREIQGHKIAWFLVLSAPAMSTLVWGQVYGWAFLASALAWYFERRERYIAAGIAVGFAVALRPTMLFWVAILYLAGYRKIAVSSFITVYVLFASPLFFYGPAIYSQWMNAFGGDRHWMSPVNIALIPTFSRLGLRGVGVACAVTLAAWVAWRVYKMRPDFGTASGIALCLGMLCAPLAWSEYILFVAPFFMVRRWNIVAWTAAALLMVRIVFPDSILGVVYLIATGLILTFFLGLMTDRSATESSPLVDDQRDSALATSAG